MRVVPELEVLLCCRKKKKALSIKQVDLMDMFKKASKCVCTSTILVSPDPLFPAPSTSAAMKATENIEEDPHNLNQQVKEISKWNSLLISCLAQV
jgi:hypothetical protein